MNDQTPGRFVLRNLPGVAEIEAALAKPNALWDPSNDDLQERVDRLSRRLFGVTEADTMQEWPEGLVSEAEIEAARRASERWEENFEFFYHDFDQTRIIWEAAGWDVTTADGEAMYALEKFGRQIIAALRALLPAARLPTAENLARPVEAPEAETAKDAALWGEQLAEDARRFKRG